MSSSDLVGRLLPRDPDAEADVVHERDPGSPEPAREDAGGDDVGSRDDSLIPEPFSDSSDDASARCRRASFRILSKAQEKWIVAGFLVGFLLCLLYISWVVMDERFGVGVVGAHALPANVTEPCVDRSTATSERLPARRCRGNAATIAIRKPLFIAILTQEKFLATRGAACNSTWARGSYVTEVKFFTQTNDGSAPPRHHSSDIAHLTGDYKNDYFHAQKTFSVIEEICSDYVAFYDWFLLSTDDVYVRINQLHAFLADKDPDQKWYVGHKTYPVQDTAHSVLRGQPYCMTGPGIVLSRALMTALCQVVSHCLSPRAATMLYPDVLLAKCLRDHFNVTCLGYNKLFVDSHEKERMRRLRRFLQDSEKAITLHPVKAGWTMSALHTHYSEITIRHLLETFRSLNDGRRKLGNPPNILSSASQTAESSMVNTANEQRERTVTEEARFDENMQIYETVMCNPTQQATPRLVTELRKIVHLANTSLQLGEGLQCPSMISGSFRRHEYGATYSVYLKCFKESSSGSSVIAHVNLERALKSLTMKKIRKRKLNPEIVIVISTWKNNPGLFSYLIRLDEVIRLRGEQFAVYLLLMDDNDPEYENASVKHGYPDGDQWKVWWSGSHVIHRVFQESKRSAASVLKKLVHDVMSHFPEATVIVTNTERDTDSDMITKCKTLVRKGKRMYYPFPVIRTVDGNEANRRRLRSQPTNAEGPYCISAADLDTLLASTDSLLSGTSLHIGKRPRVVRATEYPSRPRFI